MKRYTGSPWQVSLSELKYWVVASSFITHEICSFDEFSIQIYEFSMNFCQILIFSRRNKENHGQESQKLFNIHSYWKLFNIKSITDFNYVRNQPTTFPNKSFFSHKQFVARKLMLFETALDNIFVSTFNKEIEGIGQQF